tara:strand:+ start:108 stop:533 length:426 start_codon:yes stop_codon:yes gene_type:complete
MFVDSKLEFSDAQALTATAVSTNVLPVSGNIGPGEPMAVAVTVNVAADTTTGNETYQFILQTATDAAFTSAINLITTEAFDGSTLLEGKTFMVPVGSNNLSYLRMNYVLGGTTPTITVDAHLQPQSMIDNKSDLPVNYVIV